MPQFFIKQENISGNKCKITGNDFRHLKTVRRVNPGDSIDVRLEDGSLCRAKILEVSDSEIIAGIKSLSAKPVSWLNLVLCCAVLKGKSFDLVLQKAAEIGISRIIPVHTERTVPNLSGKKERWEKILLNASKQCMRSDVPAIDDIRKFHHLVKSEFPGKKLIAHPDNRSADDIPGLNNITGITVLIGPEGGFSTGELKLAKENNWKQFTFGDTSLKAETASIVLPSILLYEWKKQNPNIVS